MESCGKLLVCFFVGLIFISGFVDAMEENCVYTFFVSTGTQTAAGTCSNINATLFNKYGEVISISSNLVNWGGLMDPTHTYFQSGNLDIFSGRGNCLYNPICGLNLTSDGTGTSSNWFCNYVSVTYTGPDIPCLQEHFNVSQWIGNNTGLSITRNNCNSSSHFINNPTATSAVSRRVRFNNILLPKASDY